MQIVTNQPMTAKPADLHKAIEYFDLRMICRGGQLLRRNGLVLPMWREILTIPPLFQAFPCPNRTSFAASGGRG